MHLSSTTTDNVTEILAKIVEFTNRRREILTRNIVDINNAGFVPKDLDVEVFADLMTDALSEHVFRERLLLRDSDHIKFGAGGSFEPLPIVDEEARELHKKNKTRYMELQVKKLSENMFNNIVAAELLRQKQDEI